MEAFLLGGDKENPLRLATFEELWLTIERLFQLVYDLGLLRFIVQGENAVLFGEDKRVVNIHIGILFEKEVHGHLVEYLHVF